MPKTRSTVPGSGIRLRLDADLRSEVDRFVAASGLPNLTAAVRTLIRLGLDKIEFNRSGGFTAGVAEGRAEGLAEVRRVVSGIAAAPAPRHEVIDVHVDQTRKLRRGS